MLNISVRADSMRIGEEALMQATLRPVTAIVGFAKEQKSRDAARNTS
jgi:hypothetical protein